MIKSYSKSSTFCFILCFMLFISCKEQKNQAPEGTKNITTLNMINSDSIKHFKWFHEPKSWKVTSEGLSIEPDSGSDFWQRTHYGFRNDNAHFLYKEVEGDFEMTTTVSFSPKHRYDQAGLCVRLDEDNWLKTSTEYETSEFSHLGAVVTNLGYSDWSTQEIPTDIRRVEYKIIRKGQDFEIYAKYGQKDFQQIRIAHLHKEAPKINIGLYACSPTDKGFSALFETFEIKKKEK